MLSVIGKGFARPRIGNPHSAKRFQDDGLIDG